MSNGLKISWWHILSGLVAIQTAFSAGLYSRFPNEISILLGHSFLFSQSFILAVYFAGFLIFIKVQLLLWSWAISSKIPRNPEFSVDQANVSLWLLIAFSTIVSFIAFCVGYLSLPYSIYFGFCALALSLLGTIAIIHTSYDTHRVARRFGNLAATRFALQRKRLNHEFWFSASRQTVLVLIALILAIFLGYLRTNTILESKRFLVRSGGDDFTAALVHSDQSLFIFYRRLRISDSHFFTRTTYGDFKIVPKSKVDFLLIPGLEGYGGKH